MLILIILKFKLLGHIAATTTTPHNDKPPLSHIIAGIDPALCIPASSDL
jgi:hypothetical protein